MKVFLERENTRQGSSSIAAFFFLALLVALAYWNSLDGGFPLDDETLIENNVLITALDYIPRLFTTDYWAGARDLQVGSALKSGRYRPFLLSTFAVQYWWTGLDPYSLHAVNLLLHAAVSWLVYLLALRIGVAPLGAMIAGTIFAVHPIHSEPVNMLVGRAELLMALGVMAGLLWAIQGRQWLSLGAFACALLSKEQAAVLPLLLALYHYCFEDRSGDGSIARRLLVHGRSYSGLILVLVLYLIARTLVLGKTIMTPVKFIEDPLSYLSWTSWFLTVLKAAGRYISLCLWPHPLSADYSYESLTPAVSILDVGFLFGVATWGGLFALAAWNMAKGNRRPAFLIGFTILTFLPGSNLLFPVGTPMAERLFYLPSAGLCILAGLGVQSLTSRLSQQVQLRFLPRTVAIGSIFVFLALLVLILYTRERNRDWINTESIMLAVLRVYPNNAKAHAWLGSTAITRGDWELALRHYQDTLRIYPEYEAVEPAVPANLGLALVETGHVSEGIDKIEKAVRMEPSWSELPRILGVAYAKARRYAEAEHAFQEAIRLNPDNRHAHFALSYLYLERGNYEPAIHEAEIALKAAPDFMQPHYIRARALESLGRNQEAIEEYARVMRMPQTPGDVAERFYRLHAAQQSGTNTSPDRTQALH